jgi:hypothetical protein
MKNDPTRKALRLATTTGVALGMCVAGWIIYLFQSVAGLEHAALAIASSSTVALVVFVRETLLEGNRARKFLRRHRESLARPSSAEWRPCVIESPYAGDTDEEVAANIRYLRAAMNWCLHNGYAPFASHGLYTQPGVLRDEVHGERHLGIDAGKAVGRLMPVRLVFAGAGVTPGMREVLDEPVGDQVVVSVRLSKAWLDAWEDEVQSGSWRGWGTNA